VVEQEQMGSECGRYGGTFFESSGDRNMDAHDCGAAEDRMAGAAQYRAGVFPWINDMATTVSAVAGNSPTLKFEGG
jgi:hypothetical protein